MCPVDKHMESEACYLMHISNTLLRSVALSWTGIQVATYLKLVTWIELQ
jgi:hypothetical protein